MVEISRRKLLTGLISFIAAPAIVRASALMPVKSTVISPTIVLWGDSITIGCGINDLSLGPEEVLARMSDLVSHLRASSVNYAIVGTNPFLGVSSSGE